MTTITMRYIGEAFLITGKDIECPAQPHPDKPQTRERQSAI